MNDIQHTIKYITTLMNDDWLRKSVEKHMDSQNNIRIKKYEVTLWNEAYILATQDVYLARKSSS